MRTVVTVGAAVLSVALVAACSSGGGHESQPSSQPRMSMPAGAPHIKTTTPTTTTTSPMPTTAPAAGTPMSRVIKWVEAGTPAEPSGFHTATRDGQPTNLGEDIAFVAPSGSARCATDKNLGGQLACLIKADDLPSKPADVEGQWIPGWVDFAGETVDVGSLHGDPGRFGYGDGAQLAEGKSLAFGDYRCRADATTLVCVNYAHQSGVLLNSSGVEPLGCLKPVPPPVGVGRQLRCPPD
ncbi:MULTISPECIES: hypothetical protein [Mycolicibacterium]|uniref:LppI n=2 Tax=Mycolicibacterium TaxID=1866885 RepID=A0ABX3VCQ8_9MYCO|nr:MULTISPECIES: hypothetical protein [Mycolicibacterium]MCV7338812.1 hypothetical protein [Mycolicibacterium senegalense]MDR7290478.1 hypothetical protein [Mycolicibacterium senegalense]OMB78460.1 hypothetical protein A5743_16295 [Mycolicibacterium conceptionense]ORV30495.1 hypothetical protein AWB98_04350 [Mycolicibacterium conceptionense]QZA22066.1 hypothetical protein K3U95_14860 [Mycolicibacterium senegalense]